jgi:hypothetical protein
MTKPARILGLAVFASASFAAGMLCLGVLAPKEARAQSTPKTLSVTTSRGLNSAAISGAPKVTCTMTASAPKCTVTVTSAVASTGLSGVCNFVTHNPADARALVTQLTDATARTFVSCSDTSVVNATDERLFVTIDLSSVSSTQGYLF